MVPKLLGSTAVISEHFEWDDDKARQNVLSHDGVTFEEAQRVFDDLFALSREDRREDYGEQRFIQIGMVANRILVVAYTLRADRIRIISARKAEAAERRRYHDEER
jgi:uncharacterized protein